MKRTNASIIAEIAQKLDGKVNFTSLEFDDTLSSEEEREKGDNCFCYVGKKHDVYFYTLWDNLERVVMNNEDVILPTYVGVDGTLKLFHLV